MKETHPSRVSTDNPPSANPDGRVLPFDLSRIAATVAPPDVDFVDYSSLRIDSDLTVLLQDVAIRKRYREGRYVPGKNVSIRLPSLPGPVSHTIGSIGHYSKIEGGIGVGAIVSLAMHIGAMEMLKWESVSKLATLAAVFNRDQPGMTRLEQAITSHYLNNFQPPELPRTDRSLVIPIFVSDAITDLAKRGFYGMLPAAVGSYCVMLVMANQPKNYVNKHDAEELRQWAVQLEVALELKAEIVSGLGEKVRAKERIEMETEI